MRICLKICGDCGSATGAASAPKVARLGVGFARIGVSILQKLGVEAISDRHRHR
jgi:hypothetical protein